VLRAVLLTVLVLGLLTWLGTLVPMRGLLEWVRGTGPWGPVAFVAVYVAATVAFVPGSVLAASSGALFGFAQGCLLAFLGGNLGALAAFLVARALGRKRIEKRVSHLGRVEDLDEAVGRHGVRVNLLLRFSHAPTNALNYMFGLTRISVGQFVLGNVLGFLPGMAFVVYAGSLAGTALGVREIDRERTPLEWTLFGLGAALSVVTTWLFIRFARRAMHRRARHASS
jgi:uncharacterized membrane protein YdjX (TVP38/TMEM64 family)